MDPNATVREIMELLTATDRTDVCADARQAIALSQALVGWLARGGFRPTGPDAEQAIRFAELTVEMLAADSARCCDDDDF